MSLITGKIVYTGMKKIKGFYTKNKLFLYLKTYFYLNNYNIIMQVVRHIN